MDFVAKVLPANFLASSSIGNRMSHRAFILLIRILGPILRLFKASSIVSLLAPINVRVPTLVVSREIILVFRFPLKWLVIHFLLYRHHFIIVCTFLGSALTPDWVFLQWCILYHDRTSLVLPQLNSKKVCLYGFQSFILESSKVLQSSSCRKVTTQKKI